jgi:hypothetical protein
MTTLYSRPFAMMNTAFRPGSTKAKLLDRLERSKTRHLMPVLARFQRDPGYRSALKPEWATRGPAPSGNVVGPYLRPLSPPSSTEAEGDHDYCTGGHKSVPDQSWHAPICVLGETRMQALPRFMPSDRRRRQMLATIASYHHRQPAPCLGSVLRGFDAGKGWSQAGSIAGIP